MLYVDDASIILSYLKASSIASAISSLVKSVETTFLAPFSFNISSNFVIAFLVFPCIEEYAINTPSSSGI